MARARGGCALALALAMIAQAPAAAAPPRVSIDDLTGAWSFETDPHQSTQCVIRGNATATRNGPGLSITIDAHETCPNGNEWRAEESCSASLAANVLTVRCTLVSATSPNYLADQFSLQVLSPSYLGGRLADGGQWDNPVRWRRGAGLIS
jgi:hypothetical protein